MKLFVKHRFSALQAGGLASFLAGLYLFAGLAWALMVVGVLVVAGATLFEMFDLRGGKQNGTREAS